MTLCVGELVGWGQRLGRTGRLVNKEVQMPLEEVGMSGESYFWGESRSFSLAQVALRDTRGEMSGRPRGQARRSESRSILGPFLSLHRLFYGITWGCDLYLLTSQCGSARPSWPPPGSSPTLLPATASSLPPSVRLLQRCLL